MVTRKVSKSRYFLAFLITLVVFVLGLLLGLVIEGKRVQLIELQDQQQKLDFSSLQLQYQMVNLFGEEKNCEALKKTFVESSRNLEVSRQKLEEYLLDTNFNKEKFNLLKREYTLAQLNFWLLIKKTKDVCDLEHAVIFYFYGDNNICPECADQAYVLTYLKNKLGAGLLNFAFDAQFEEEPLITILKESYGIKVYPSLIVNGKKLERFVPKEEILKEICPLYKNTPTELCEGQKIIKVG